MCELRTEGLDMELNFVQNHDVPHFMNNWICLKMQTIVFNSTRKARFSRLPISILNQAQSNFFINARLRQRKFTTRQTGSQYYFHNLATN